MPTFDPAALIRRHQTGLWRFLRGLGAAPELAEDLLQDTFVVALRKLEQDLGEAAVATFLRQTARHLYLRRRRDGARREAILVEVAEQMWQRDCARDDGEAWLEALRGCVAQLDGRARQAILRFYGDGVDRVQLAGELGMKENGVKALLQRVRAALRECVLRRLGGGA